MDILQIPGRIKYNSLEKIYFDFFFVSNSTRLGGMPKISRLANNGGGMGWKPDSRFGNPFCDPHSDFRKIKTIFGNSVVLIFQIFWKHWKSFQNYKMQAFWKLIAITKLFFLKVNFDFFSDEEFLEGKSNYNFKNYSWL